MGLDELYREIILNHYRAPHHFKKIEGPTAFARKENSVCGDRIEVMICVDGEGRLQEVAFQGAACAICTASASIMCDLLQGKTLAQAQDILQEFMRIMLGEQPAQGLSSLGDAKSLEGVLPYPSRTHCALVAWQAMEECTKTALERS